jgi:hypothetical protein
MSDTTDRTGAVVVAYVHSNDCTMSWHHSIIEMLAYDLANEGRVMRGGWLAIHCGTDGLMESRNMAVRTFLKDKQADWLFWIDTDMGFNPDIIDQLMHAADPVERPMVGALCFSLRELEPDGMGGYKTLLSPTIFDWTQDGDQSGFAVRWDFPENTLVRCSGTGSACILIHRSVFEKIEKSHGPVWYTKVPNTTTGQIVSEDLSFCLRAGALAIPLHVHTGVEASHAKTRWCAVADYREQLNNEAIRLTREQEAVPKASEPTAVFIPVLGRLERAQEYMDYLRASTDMATGYAIVNEDDEDAKRAWRKAGAKVISGPVTTYAEKMNLALAQTTEPWIFLADNDVKFHPRWLDFAQHLAKTKPAAVVGTNDLGNPRVRSGNHATHMLIRRSYIEEQGASWDGPGKVTHEGYRHWFVDDEIVTVAKQRGEFASAKEAIVEHLHPLWGKGATDEVYGLGQSFSDRDQALFEQRREAHAATAVR